MTKKSIYVRCTNGKTSQIFVMIFSQELEILVWIVYDRYIAVRELGPDLENQNKYLGRFISGGLFRACTTADISVLHHPTKRVHR